MHEITEHEQNLTNMLLKVRANDDPSHGGANHIYVLDPPNGEVVVISFQNGPIQEVGVNGVTNEALIAIILDRMRAFQESEYKCRENAIAITKLEEALMWLHKRTENREERGVEGTHQV